MEKIKNYNQKMLAVLCTLGIVFLLVCIIMIVVTFWPSGSSEYQPQGLIADEKTDALNQGNLRKQIVSYEIPWLIDTLKSTYIVPVSIKTLRKPEGTVVSSGESNDRLRLTKGDYYSHKHFDGKYANLIIYDAVEEKVTSLFNERIIIGNVQAYYFQNDILMVFYAASKDTDKNGVIDLEDIRSLYIYSVNTRITRMISDGDNQVISYKFVENSKNLLVEFQLSQYKESQFESNHFPKKIAKYNFDSQQLSNIIPDAIQSERYIQVINAIHGYTNVVIYI